MAGYNPETYPWYQCDEEDYDSGTPPEEQMATEPAQVDELPPLDLDEESVEIYRKRHDVAEAFFAQYIDVGEGVTSEQIVDALVDLLSCEGDLDQIIQSMALEMP